MDLIAGPDLWQARATGVGRGIVDLSTCQMTLSAVLDGVARARGPS